jgi:subtilase family serine protease
VPGDLGKGKTVNITIDVFQTAEGGRSLDNEACVDPDDTIEESNELNNCSTASTASGSDKPRLKPDIAVIKTVSPSGPVTPGTELTTPLPC